MQTNQNAIIANINSDSQGATNLISLIHPPHSKQKLGAYKRLKRLKDTQLAEKWLTKALIIYVC